MREAVGIDLAEEGTVGEAEVVHCAAHRLAQNVHVAGDVRGRHVVEDRPTAAITCARQRPVSLLLHGLLPRGHREREWRDHRQRSTEGGEALQRRAPHHSARIESDEVETGPQRQRQELAD